MSSPKVITAKALISERAQIRKDFLKKWGVYPGVRNRRARDLGESNGHGSEFFDDSIRAIDKIKLLNRLINSCTTYNGNYRG